MNRQLKAFREVYCADANVWLKENKGHKVIITSLPDMEEVGMNLTQWEDFIRECCFNIIASLADDGVVFFYQTDRKYKGQIIDKKTLISGSFKAHGFKNIMSKIVLKQAVETTNLFRPTYTNLVAFSRVITTAKSTPDVFHAGKMVYRNAMGENAVRCCVEFLLAKKIQATIVDPFCGMGSVLKIANELGYSAIGVDILPEQVEIAKSI